ncbi:MAG: DUF2069 domain-containing protein [Gammaproteobacteria bacterium]|nr:DUF2069 domain-containing protein [Gammaproteobacteria bacterium]
MHPLKIVSLASWLLLFGCQLGLLWPTLEIDLYWVALACLPLLVPLPGLLRGRRYTYKWVGFLTLIYFCVGVSETMANPALLVYGLGTTFGSVTLFLAAIYYTRFLRQAGD